MTEKFIDCNQYENIYINKDFDKILVDQNNHLINSYKYYIKYKNDYISNSKEILLEYKNLLDELNHLNELEKIVISNTKIIYTFIDKEKIESIHKKLTKLLTYQNKSFNHFLNYIDSLNLNINKYKLNENENTTKNKQLNKDINKNDTKNDDNNKIIKSIAENDTTTIKSKKPPSIASIESGKRPSSIKSFDMEKRRPPSVKSLDLRNKTVRKALFSMKLN